MFLEYDEFHQTHLLMFSEKDKCHFCHYSAKCPLIRALDKGEYVLSRYKDVPTHDFCELYEPNARLKKLEKDLNKKSKAREK